MKVRVIDYIGNEGGGVRFAVELLRALVARGADAQVELVSHGAALGAYRGLLGRDAAGCGFVDLPPARSVDGWRFDVPPAALADCDVAWLPWVHRHRLPDSGVGAVIGSFHDAIMFTEPSLRAIFGAHLDDERETVARWLASPARVVVSSQATVATMRGLFGVAPERLDVVPVSGAHAAGDAVDPPGVAVPEPWAERPFLLCPANISPHKNHDTLFRGVAAWGRRHPLVLTGTLTDLPRSRNVLKRAARAGLEALGVMRRSRVTELRRLARREGYRLGRSLLPVGYVDDQRYYALLRRAWALVMPTFAEGGGSFPVEEALWFGVPVVCSDIPVLREHMARLGATVLWFDPRDAAALARALQELERDYAAHKARAVRQVQTMRRRAWADVADEYWTILTEVAAPPVTQ